MIATTAGGRHRDKVIEEFHTWEVITEMRSYVMRRSVHIVSTTVIAHILGSLSEHLRQVQVMKVNVGVSMALAIITFNVF